MFENTYSFDLPASNKSIIKVIGVGGGGSNAVNHMYNQGIRDVEFVVCNTDSQALKTSPIPTKLQIGINLTSGLGAGANPEKGRNAAIESKEDIRELLSEDTKMLFITAGMGGGTGTGAAPVIAQVARELDILTVGIVTAPFGFEGRKKQDQANEGIRQLREHCDTVIVIRNDKIKEMFGNLPIREAFTRADNVLTTAAKGIAEIITVPGYVNVDFEDVKTVMKDAGAAVMGSAQTSGDKRARRAAEAALCSPLLNNQNIRGAQKILLSIMSGEEAELQMDELAEITDFMQEFAGTDAEVIFGHGIDSELGDNIQVTVIATGFEPTKDDLDSFNPIQKRMELGSVSTKESVEDEKESPSVQFSRPIVQQAPTLVPEPVKKRIIDLEAPTKNGQISLFGEAEDTPKKEQKPTTFEWDLTPKKDSKKEPPQEKEDILDEFTFDLPENNLERDDFSLAALKEAFEIEDEDENKEEDAPLEELKGMAHPASRKAELLLGRQQREELLSQVRPIQNMDHEAFREKWDVPAYERKKVNLQKVPHSSERNISRYQLTDENQIQSNNKFLHDNVD